MKFPKCLQHGDALVLLGQGGDGGQREVDCGCGILLFDVECGELVAVLHDNKCAALIPWQRLDEEELSDVLAVDDDVPTAFSAGSAEFHAFFTLAVLGQLVVDELPELSHDSHSLPAFDASVAGDAEHAAVARAGVHESQRHLAAANNPIGSRSCSREIDEVGEGHVVALDVELARY